MKQINIIFRKKSNLPILFLFLSITSFSQSTYFVSSEGNNSNSGTKESPFLNISYAITQAVDNDTIHVLGTITENNIQVNKTLIITGDAANSSIIQAQSTNPHTETTRNPIANNRIFRLSAAASRVTFENLTLRHGNLLSGQGAVIYSSVTAELFMKNCNIINN